MSFLGNINSYFKLIPDCRPKINTQTEIGAKSGVFLFPINIDLESRTQLCVSSCLNDLIDLPDYKTYAGISVFKFN
jgi:hypothetical protein